MEVSDLSWSHIAFSLAGYVVLGLYCCVQVIKWIANGRAASSAYTKVGGVIFLWCGSVFLIAFVATFAKTHPFRSNPI
jgi:hypothetical protein